LAVASGVEDPHAPMSPAPTRTAVAADTGAGIDAQTRLIVSATHVAM
jgi:hypothetical protein